MRFIAIAAIALLALPASGQAADTVVNLPAGWRAEPQPIQYRAGTLAVLVGPTAGGGPTHLFTWRAGGTTFTPVPSRPFGIDVSADGQFVLVGSTSAMPTGHESGAVIHTLINSTGAVVGTSTDANGRSFGLASTRLLQWNMDAGPGAFELASYDLSGNRLGRVKPQKRVLAAEMLGEPAIMAYATGGDVTGVDPTHLPSAELWKAHLVGDEYAIIGLRRLSAGRLVAEQSYGWFKVLGTNGQWLYSYDPVALDAADPAHDWRYYAGFRPFATPDPNWLILTDESPSALFLNIVTGQILPVTINTSAAAGFTLTPRVMDYSLVLVGSTSVRIRPLPTLP